MEEFVFGGETELEFFEYGEELFALFALVAAGAVLEDDLHWFFENYYIWNYLKYGPLPPCDPIIQSGIFSYKNQIDSLISIISI